MGQEKFLEEERGPQAIIEREICTHSEKLP